MKYTFSYLWIKYKDRDKCTNLELCVSMVWSVCEVHTVSLHSSCIYMNQFICGECMFLCICIVHECAPSCSDIAVSEFWAPGGRRVQISGLFPHPAVTEQRGHLGGDHIHSDSVYLKCLVLWTKLTYSLTNEIIYMLFGLQHRLHHDPQERFTKTFQWFSCTKCPYSLNKLIELGFTVCLYHEAKNHTEIKPRSNTTDPQYLQLYKIPQNTRMYLHTLEIKIKEQFMNLWFFQK